MASGRPLRLTQFGAGDPLDEFAELTQAKYLRTYLSHLKAATVVEEHAYFDRDYLSEFAAFYATSARGYPNTCRRLHFFASEVTRASLRAAVGGSPRVRARLQKDYLGFVVVRPIRAAPFGRTVLRWFPEHTLATPRVTDPQRTYTAHLAGIPLKVDGIAWQQQDMGVSACATVATWSMLHSSAFDDHHAIPTTADVTRFAHRTASLGDRIFPSRGLNVHQLCEAIKEARLAPMIMVGDEDSPYQPRFTRERFSSSLAMLVRSGYPTLVLGNLEKTGLHAVCAVGFREAAPPAAASGAVEMQDRDVRFVYVHDDNLGPNVRFEVIDHGGFAALKTSPPAGSSPTKSATASYPIFVPFQLVTAVHEDLRTAPDELNEAAGTTAGLMAIALTGSGGKGGFTVSTRFCKIASFIDRVLGQTLKGAPLARTRLAMHERVGPMSLHVGLARIGYGARPIVDILYDTTDSDRNLRAFCHVVYVPHLEVVTRALTTAGEDLGIEILST